jgi:hypothetical protein
MAKPYGVLSPKDALRSRSVAEAKEGFAYEFEKYLKTGSGKAFASKRFW